MQKKLIVAPSPFLRNTQVSTRSIMLDVIIAMLPTALAAVWFFGAPALSVMVVCVLGCVVAEWAYQRLTHQPVTTGDLSAVVTGLLLAFNMPASAPWWMGLIGSVIAIVLVKQMFGGIGQNFINPALAARTVLMLSWTVLMAANVLPQPGQIFGIDPEALKNKPIAIVQTVYAEGTSEATAAATGETTAAPVTETTETTTEATAAATGETAAAPATETTEATAEATGAATGETTAAAATETTTEATAAATGATEATSESTSAATASVEATASATGTTVEATSVATPLSASVQPGDYTLWDLFSGNIPGMLGETCKLTLILGSTGVFPSALL